MEEFRFKGTWWLPESPEKKVVGILTSDLNSLAELELVGSLKAQNIEELLRNKELTQHKIILGLTTNGKAITLYQCFEASSSVNMKGSITSFIKVQIAFVGHHFEKEEDIIFDSISLNYDNLEEWVGISGFIHEAGKDPKDKSVFAARYVFPDAIKVSLEGVSIIFTYNFTSEGIGGFEEHQKQTNLIKAEPVKPIHFNEYHTICYNIQNFLCLGLGVSTHPKMMIGKNKSCKFDMPDGKTIYEDIQIYHFNTFEKTSKPIHHFDMFFTLQDIRDDLEKCLKNWFEKADKLKPVYDLYFGTLYNSSMYLEHMFLSLSQAIESYHRRTYAGKGTYLPKEDYEKIREIVAKGVPKDIDTGLRDNILAKLRYSNEFPLKRRLEDIINRCKVLEPLIPDKNEFINNIADARNFLTHFSKELEKKAKCGQELLILVRKMKLVLQVCFLLELGLTQAKVDEIIKRNREYIFLTGQQRHPNS